MSNPVAHFVAHFVAHRGAPLDGCATIGLKAKICGAPQPSLGGLRRTLWRTTCGAGPPR